MYHNIIYSPNIFLEIVYMKNSISGSMSRPCVNGPFNNYENYIGINGAATIRRAFPMKHWRKQLTPSQGSGRSKVTISELERPGGSTTVQDTCVCEKDNYSTAYTVIDYKPNINNADVRANTCCPSRQRIRSASTLVSPGYCASNSQYLQSRCKTYNQNLNGNNTCDCDSKNGCNSIYNPNNTPFAQQGAVSSSTRLLKLQVDTITANGNSFRSAWGANAANAGKYHGTSITPYFLKNKYEKCTSSCY